MAENLRIDHVIFGTADIDGAARALLDRHGLGSIEGGRHEGRGTGNRIVPLGSSYLELMGVVDPVEAAAHPFGRWFTEQVADGDRFLMWCVGTDDIDAVAARLDLEVEEWTRATPDGSLLSWRLAGLQISNEHPEIPFFIQWDIPESAHPRKANATHRVRPTAIQEMVLAGDDAQVTKWLGGASLPVRFTTDPPGVRGLTIATEDGGITIP